MTRMLKRILCLIGLHDNKFIPEGNPGCMHFKCRICGKETV